LQLARLCPYSTMHGRKLVTEQEVTDQHQHLSKTLKGLIEINSHVSQCGCTYIQDCIIGTTMCWRMAMVLTKELLHNNSSVITELGIAIIKVGYLESPDQIDL